MQTKQVRANVELSSGRVIAHEWHENGYQVATPTTGSEEMTNEEWIEYCEIIRKQ